MASNPSRIKSIETNEGKMDVLIINEIPNFEKEDYALYDNKDEENYIKDIEKIVRNSFEYQELIQYLRKYMDMNKCSYFEGISNTETNKIKIHIHHSPITLYEIVVTIYEKRKFYGENLDAEAVAKEVTYCHYCLLIGLIPLCETVHELVHNEFLFIPNDAVLGQYHQFIQMYYPWVPKQSKDKFDRLEEYTRLYNEDENLKILQPHYIYLGFEGTYKLPKMEDILVKLQNRMDAIKANNFSIEPQPLVRFYDENGRFITHK